MDSWYLDATLISIAFLGTYLAQKIKFPPLIGFLVAGFTLNITG